MANISLIDKTFRPFIQYEQLQKTVKKVAASISSDMKDENVLFVCILNGAFMFASEVFREVDLIQPEITFVKYFSYKGTQSTGKVGELIGLKEDVTGKTLVILEDIVDTGTTIDEVFSILNAKHPKQIKVATLMYKPNKHKGVIPVDYVGMEIGDEFIVGFGLDYNGKGRNLKDIYVVTE